MDLSLSLTLSTKYNTKNTKYVCKKILCVCACVCERERERLYKSLPEYFHDQGKQQRCTKNDVQLKRSFILNLLRKLPLFL